MSQANRSSMALDFGSAGGDVYDDPDSMVLFEGVMSRRVVANLLDLVAIGILCVVLSIPFFILGILTFGLLFFIYGLFLAAIAFAYITLSLGGERGATPGMRAMDIELRTLNGLRPGYSLAFLHALIYFILNTAVTPFILLVGLFNRRGRLVHDFFCGTVMVNTESRADYLLRR